MSDIEWSATNFYDCKFRKISKLEEVTEHPLKPATVTVVNGRPAIRRGTLRSTQSTSSSTTRTSTPTHTNISTNIGSTGDPLSSHSSLDGSDPLTQFVREEMDPLTKMATDEWDYSANNTAGQKVKDKLDESVEPWSSRRISILNKYTTLEKLSIVTSFLPGGEKVITKVQPTGSVVDKVKTRLEQLDDFEDGSVRLMLNLTQSEYMSRIEQLNCELVQAWHSEQRVKALKIAIQCAKLLVDTSVLSFYPSKYVLITDVLDIFGKLVFERLKVKAEYTKPGNKVSTTIPDCFTCEMVPEAAKETSQNWFYKIASIRELVPRLYLEMALLKSYLFLKNSNEIYTVVQRITKMIRGIGDPLVSVYARCYLCRVGFNLNKFLDQDYVKENFYDFLLVYPQTFSQSIKCELSKQNLNMSSYLNIYIPALEWIVQILTAYARDNLLTEVFNKCNQLLNNGLLLNTILNSYKPVYIVSRSMEFIKLIENSEKNDFPQHILYKSFGECLIKEPPSKEDCQPIFDIVWKYMSSLKDATRFILLMEVYIEFAVTHFTTPEVNLFLGAVITHLNKNRNFENFYPQLQNIVAKLVATTQDPESLLTMDNFLPFVDLFQKESLKVEICKTIMETLSKQQCSPIVDTIMINALMFIMKIIHDSVSALTVEDEKRQIGQLICGVIQRVNYARDFEKQLNFYVEARAAFQNLDIVHIQLVQCVNRLAADTRKIVRGHHTRRTSAFVRACSAFCFITIPSLSQVFPKLQLYLLSGQVSLLNQCFGQADACFKAALNLVPEMSKTVEIDGRNKSSEPYMLSYLSNFLSTLLVVPDSPEHGVLYLLRGLLNAVQRYFEENSIIKSHLYLRVLDLTSTMTQEVYPHHIDKVDSNDKLYGSDPKFIDEVDKISSMIFRELLNQLKYLGSTEQSDKQSALAMEILICMLLRADLQKPNLLQMAMNLWNLSQKNGIVDPKIRLKTLDYMVKKGQSLQYQHFNDIIKKLSV